MDRQSANFDAADWTGGLEPEIDWMLPGRPDDPEMRESVSVWLFEENGTFAFPRMGIEAVGAARDNHRCDCNAAFAGGRVLRESTTGPTHPVRDAAGRNAVLGAGGLEFRCVEPFRRWEVRYESSPHEARVEDQIAGRFSLFAGREADPEGFVRTPVLLEASLTMAAPAWTQDYRAERLAGMSERERADAGSMGYGWRIEQMFRGEGRLTIDGRTRSFRCNGSRIHRQSVRPMGAFRGHCWQSAIFPDGRAFGFIAYPPAEDGSTYNNGYVWQDGKMHPARVRQAPFLRRVMAEGDDVGFELESDLGITRIEGRTALTTIHMGNPGVRGFNNQQGGVHYAWDGHTAWGMIERSSPAELCAVVE